MKLRFLTGAILLQFISIAQSPGLSIWLKMEPVKAEGRRYKIEMNSCKPKKMTPRGSLSSHDTTTIDFASLRANDIECGGYFDKGTPTLISGKVEESPFNQFHFSGQVFAWEEIYVFKISDLSSKGLHTEMYIMIPIKYKSFVTRIELNDLEFQSGKVIFLADYNASYHNSKGLNYLGINQSLKNYKAVDLKNFPLKDLL